MNDNIELAFSMYTMCILLFVIYRFYLFLRCGKALPGGLVYHIGFACISIIIIGDGWLSLVLIIMMVLYNILLDGQEQ